MHKYTRWKRVNSILRGTWFQTYVDTQIQEIQTSGQGYVDTQIEEIQRHVDIHGYSDTLIHKYKIYRHMVTRIR